jgi:chitin disaccharide deacetylase
MAVASERDEPRPASGVPAQAAQPATRRIWLCADDYAIAPGVNAAIRDLVLRGRLNATSVMAVAPSFNRSEAISLGILNAGSRRVAIGLHLTLTAPFRPLTKGFAPLAEGAFLPLEAMMKAAYLRKLQGEPIAAEVRAQFLAFATAFGRPPDFVDGHRHVHLLPGVREAVLAALKELAPEAWVRQCAGTGPILPRLSDPKGLLVDAMSWGLRRRAQALGVATNPAFAGTYTYRDDADFATLFPRFLSVMPEGGLIMCHPGRVDAELERLDPLTTLREREYDYFLSETFPRDLAAHGVVLA